PGAVALKHHRQQAVVWRHESIAGRLRGEAAPRGADPRIDDTQKHCALREVLVRGGELERSTQDLLRGDLVRDVGGRNVGTDTKRSAPHRPDVMIAHAEIS